MIEKYKIKTNDLKYTCDLGGFDFETTQDIKPLKDIIGQRRAVEAINFGLSMKQRGYNLYVCGISGTGRTSYTNSIIEKVAKYKRDNKDWVYVYNFKSDNEPIALSFDSGVGKKFKKDVETVCEKMQNEIPKVFQSKEYELRNRYLVEEYETKIDNLMDKLNSFAKDKGFVFEISAKGLVSLPIKEDGIVMTEQEYKELTHEQFNNMKEKANFLNKEISEYTNQIKDIDTKFKEELKNLDKKIAQSVVGTYVSYLIEEYAITEKIHVYLNALKDDIVENISKFKANQQEQTDSMFGFLQKDDSKFFLRYKVTKQLIKTYKNMI